MKCLSDRSYIRPLKLASEVLSGELKQDKCLQHIAIYYSEEEIIKAAQHTGHLFYVEALLFVFFGFKGHNHALIEIHRNLLSNTDSLIGPYSPRTPLSEPWFMQISARTKACLYISTKDIGVNKIGKCIKGMDQVDCTW